MHFELHTTESALALWGGEGAIVEDLARALRVLGHTTLIVARAPAGSSVVCNVDRVAVPVPELYAPLSRDAALRVHRTTLALLANRPVPAAVLLMGLDSSPVARARARRVGAPLFYFANLPFILHRYAEGPAALNRTWRWTGRVDQLAALEQQLFDTADWVVAPGPAIARLVEQEYRVSPARLLILPWVVDFPTAPDVATAEPSRRSNDIATVLFVGRLVPQKGLHILLEAVAQLQAAGRAVRLVVAGSGEQGEAVPTFYADRPGHESVVFLGQVPRGELPPIYDAADVVAVPSLYEPCGLVCREAMARARPVVAAAIDGLAEAIEHRHTGLLVGVTEPAPWRREICPAALADALGDVLDHPEASCRMGRAAQFAFELRWQSPALLEPLFRAL